MADENAAADEPAEPENVAASTWGTAGHPCGSGTVSNCYGIAGSAGASTRLGAAAPAAGGSIGTLGSQACMTAPTIATIGTHGSLGASTQLGGAAPSAAYVTCYTFSLAASPHVGAAPAS